MKRLSIINIAKHYRYSIYARLNNYCFFSSLVSSVSLFILVPLAGSIMIKTWNGSEGLIGDPIRAG